MLKHCIMFYHGYNVKRALYVKFQLNWSILNIYTFETLYDPLMACYNIAYVLLWLECHTHTFSKVSAQLEQFEHFDF